MSTQFIEIGLDSEPDLFWWLLLGVFTGGFLVGVKATLVYLRLVDWWAERSRSHQPRNTFRFRPGWESVVVRALHEVHSQKKEDCAGLQQLPAQASATLSGKQLEGLAESRLDP